VFSSISCHVVASSNFNYRGMKVGPVCSTPLSVSAYRLRRPAIKRLYASAEIIAFLMSDANVCAPSPGSSTSVRNTTRALTRIDKERRTQQTHAAADKSGRRADRDGALARSWSDQTHKVSIYIASF